MREGPFARVGEVRLCSGGRYEHWGWGGEKVREWPEGRSGQVGWNRFSCCGVTYQGRAAREGMQCLKAPHFEPEANPGFFLGGGAAACYFLRVFGKYQHK